MCNQLSLHQAVCTECTVQVDFYVQKMFLYHTLACVMYFMHLHTGTDQRDRASIANFVPFAHHVAPHRLLCFGSRRVHHAAAGWNVVFPSDKSWRVSGTGGCFGQRTRKPISKDHYDSNGVCKGQWPEGSWCCNWDPGMAPWKRCRKKLGRMPATPKTQRHKCSLKWQNWPRTLPTWSMGKLFSSTWASSTPPSRPWIPTFLTVGNAICNPERREIFLNQLCPSPSRLFLVTKRALPQERSSIHPRLWWVLCSAQRVVGTVAFAFSHSKRQTALIDQSMEGAGEWHRSKAKLLLGCRDLPTSLFPTAHKRRALQKNAEKY